VRGGERGVRIIWFGDGIEAAPRKWAAASETLEGEQRTTASAVPCDGFTGVIRARRIKLARASEERAKNNLIQPDEREQEPRAGG